MDLAAHLGDAWQIEEDRYSRGRAILAPLGWGLGIAAGTAVCWWLADKPPGGAGRQRLVRVVLHFLGQTGVLIIGAFLLTGVALWLASRWRCPPDLLKLTRVAEPATTDEASGVA
jgi:hypothetical protein